MHLKELKVLTNEAENGFMNIKGWKIAVEFDSWEVTADSSDSNIAWVMGAETNFKVESENMITWNKVTSVLKEFAWESGEQEWD